MAAGLLEEFLVAPAGLAGASSSELSESELSEELSAAFFAGAGLGVVLQTTALAGGFFSSSELESGENLGHYVGSRVPLQPGEQQKEHRHTESLSPASL